MPSVSINDNPELTRKQFRKLYKKKSRLQEMTAVYFKNRLAVVGLFIFIVILLMTLFGHFFIDYADVTTINPKNRLQSPGGGHLLGTDDLGRDILARLLYGAKISLIVGFVSVAFSLLIGGVLGSLAGYFGGWIDNIIMRCMDVLICLPDILLAIAIVASLGASEINMLIAITIARTPYLARIIRSAVMTVRNMEYVEAARVIGMRTPQIITRHVLLNCLGPIVVQTTINIANGILTISALSFLGLGIQPPTPEWGSMLASARAYMRGHAYLVVAPGLSIFFTIFALNMMGDGLRDALDPRMKQ